MRDHEASTRAEASRGVVICMSVEQSADDIPRPSFEKVSVARPCSYTFRTPDSRACESQSELVNVSLRQVITQHEVVIDCVVVYESIQRIGTSGSVTSGSSINGW